MSDLHVITTISNLLRYQSRFKLYEAFNKRMRDDGVKLYTIELAYGDQDFAVTDNTNSNHFQVRSRRPIWHKENLVNIALKRLPSDWKYAAWVDGDISFVRPDWVAETLKQLKHHPFVQLFTHVIDLGPNFEPLKIYDGFAYRYLKERARAPHQSPAGAKDAQAKKQYGQTGNAWAASREALDGVGGLIDWSILGSNDYYMGLALVGEVDPGATRMPDSNYARKILAWQKQYQTRFAGDIGYINNAVLHYWHGKRGDRGYDTRWKILADFQFDPDTDLMVDAQGLLELTDAKPGLHDAIVKYFFSRNEDGTEV